MATKKTNELAAVNANETTSTANESRYTIDELAGAAGKLFGAGTSSELVTVALELAHKDMFTKSEAKEIVEKFKKKEVK